MSHVTYQWILSCPLWAKVGTPAVSCSPQPQQVSTSVSLTADHSSVRATKYSVWL